MAQDTGLPIRYECTGCGWSRTSAEFRAEWATGKCPECDAALRWGFASPDAAPEPDSAPPGPEADPHPDTAEPPAPVQRKRPRSASRVKTRRPSATTGRHGVRLLMFLALLGGLVFAQMTFMSDPDKAWDFLVEFFSQENPIEAQWIKLKRVLRLERSSPPPSPAPEQTAEEEPPAPKEAP